MTVKECYEMMGADYDDVFGRLRKDERIKKFATKFLDDQSYTLLFDSLEQKNYDEAFRASHTIKGICQNLGFKKLYESSHELTELLRGGQHDGFDNLLEQLKEDYALTIQAIRQMD